MAAGCTDLRDLFTPYAPHPAAVEALLATQTMLPHYDAALVLGCPAELDGAPSLCERCRVKSAVRQWRRGTIGGVVFSGENELHMLATDDDVLLVQILDGHARAVLLVLAVVGLCAGDGADLADGDGDVLSLDRASAQRNGCGDNHVQFHLHVQTSGWGER